MKTITLILCGISCLSIGHAQQIEPTIDSTTTPDPTVIYINPYLAYPDCITPPHPVIDIQQWKWPQDWSWSVPIELVYYIPQRISDTPDACFGYCESDQLCFETIQTKNSFQIHLQSHEDVTIQMELCRLDDQQQALIAYPLFGSPIKFIKGYYLFEQKLKYMPDATFLLKIKVNGEEISSRIQTKIDRDLWNIDSTCIYQMNLLEPEL